MFDKLTDSAQYTGAHKQRFASVPHSGAAGSPRASAGQLGEGGASPRSHHAGTPTSRRDPGLSLACMQQLACHCSLGLLCPPCVGRFAKVAYYSGPAISCGYPGTAGTLRGSPSAASDDFGRVKERRPAPSTANDRALKAVFQVLTHQHPPPVPYHLSTISTDHVYPALPPQN